MSDADGAGGSSDGGDGPEREEIKRFKLLGPIYLPVPKLPKAVVQYVKTLLPKRVVARYVSATIVLIMLIVFAFTLRYMEFKDWADIVFYVVIAPVLAGFGIVALKNLWENFRHRR